MSQRVLIVEDDPPTRKLLTEFLRMNGFAPVAVGSGEEALPLAEGEPPNLIILDIGLPGMDGWEILRRLQSSSSTSNIPILMLTCYDAVEDLIRAYSFGATYFIAKPYNQEELLRGMRMALAQV
jgi:DNA-binding response OmpR family regulator